MQSGSYGTVGPRIDDRTEREMITAASICAVLDARDTLDLVGPANRMLKPSERSLKR